MSTTARDRLEQLRDELLAELASPTDLTGEKVVQIASAALWARQLALAGRDGADPVDFHARTGATWARVRAQCADCPAAAARAYAREVAALVTGRS